MYSDSDEDEEICNVSIAELIENSTTRSIKPLAVKRLKLNASNEYIPKSISGDQIHVMVQKIGKGGYGSVYRLKETMCNRAYAFKALHMSLNDISVVRESAKEAQNLERLTHENIIEYYDFKIYRVEDKCYSIVMKMDYYQATLESVMYPSEIINGSPLLLELTKKLIKNEYGNVLINDMLQAINYIHEKDIIHRDIKPDNIFIKIVGNFHLITLLGDFGISKYLQKNSDGSINGLLSRGKGTAVYSAPEQKLTKKYDHTVDVYSLGVVFFEYFFQLKDVAEITDKQVADDSNTNIVSEMNNESQENISLLHLNLDILTSNMKDSDVEEALNFTLSKENLMKLNKSMKFIYSGYYGRSYLTNFENLYTLKVIDTKRIYSAETVQLVKEAKMLLKLWHRNIIKYFDYEIFSKHGEHLMNNAYIFVFKMEYYAYDVKSVMYPYCRNNYDNHDKKILEQINRKEYGISLIMDTLNGVEYLHNIKIIHRQLQPENVYLKFHDNGSITTVIGELSFSWNPDQQAVAESVATTIGFHAEELGTNIYSPPEHYEFNNTFFSSYDIFCLGLFFYEYYASISNEINEENQRINYVNEIKKKSITSSVENDFPQLAQIFWNMMSDNPINRMSAGELINVFTAFNINPNEPILLQQIDLQNAAIIPLVEIDKYNQISASKNFENVSGLCTFDGLLSQEKPLIQNRPVINRSCLKGPLKKFDVSPKFDIRTDCPFQAHDCYDQVMYLESIHGISNINGSDNRSSSQSRSNGKDNFFEHFKQNSESPKTLITDDFLANMFTSMISENNRPSASDLLKKFHRL